MPFQRILCRSYTSGTLDSVCISKLCQVVHVIIETRKHMECLSCEGRSQVVLWVCAGLLPHRIDLFVGAGEAPTWRSWSVNHLLKLVGLYFGFTAKFGLIFLCLSITWSNPFFAHLKDLVARLSRKWMKSTALPPGLVERLPRVGPEGQRRLG